MTRPSRQFVKIVVVSGCAVAVLVGTALFTKSRAVYDSYSIRMQGYEMGILITSAGIFTCIVGESEWKRQGEITRGSNGSISIHLDDEPSPLIVTPELSGLRLHEPPANNPSVILDRHFLTISGYFGIDCYPPIAALAPQESTHGQP